MDYRKRNNVLLVVGVVVAVTLLLFWLFAGTTLDEIFNPVANPVVIEQNN